MSNNILWLASWYPNVLSPYDGDFIQRHAKAVSLINRVTVFFIKKDEKGVITKNVKKEVAKTGNLTEIIVYYHSLKTGITFLDRLLSRKKYNSVYRKTLEKYIEEKSVPDLVHVHVVLNVIRQTLWLKKKYSIPFLVTEHWTGYLSVAKPNLENYYPLYKKWLQKIFKEADRITVVSKVLGEAITDRFKIKKYQVIPNVVDTNIFFPVQKHLSSLIKFLHVSLLNYQKNPHDIIEAFYLVKNRGYNFQLTVYGPNNIQLEQQVLNRDLEEQIIFKAVVPQNILVKDMQKSDALVLYSRYETFGCVVIEANACGIPAILSDLPVFREYIIENKTGIFAKPNDPENLADIIINFIQERNSFSQMGISNYTKSKFGYEVIAKQFDEVYKSILSNQNLLNA
jgi:glycosyltransferase involved in cell wall biosynthesis